MYEISITEPYFWVFVFGGLRCGGDGRGAIVGDWLRLGYCLYGAGYFRRLLITRRSVLVGRGRCLLINLVMRGGAEVVSADPQGDSDECHDCGENKKGARFHATGIKGCRGLRW